MADQGDENKPETRNKILEVWILKALTLSIAVVLLLFYSQQNLTTISDRETTQKYPASASLSSSSPLLVENASILFLGDSISRFAYISLAYFLHTGKWLHPSISHDNARASPHDGKSYKVFTEGSLYEAWLVFQKHTNELIQDEICDCYRGQFDARYYQDDRNNRVTFFMRSGHSAGVTFKSRINPREVWSNFTAYRGMPFGLKGGTPLYDYEDWAEMIRNVIGKMDPVPENLVISAALWKSRFDELEIRQNITTAANEIGIKRVLWRTGTATFGRNWNKTLYKEPGKQMDLIMCEFLGEENCIDLSFMKETHPSFYSDGDNKHFREPLNRLIGEQTLAVLGYLPKGYKRLNQSIILRPYDEVEMNKTLESLL